MHVPWPGAAAGFQGEKVALKMEGTGCVLLHAQPSQPQLSWSRCCEAGVGVMVSLGRGQLPGLPWHCRCLQLWGTSIQP